MKYNKLGDSDLRVSEICLGTMTFGKQNSLEEAGEQLDYAVACGVNFLDTAEMYPTPVSAETQGKTEEYIGEWLSKQQRDKIIVATKVTGPSRRINWIRKGNCQVDRKNITQAVSDSLRRLKTDYIDLYQIHWADRYTPIFGELEYDIEKERETIPIAEQLTVFADLIKEGKIRYLGVSNETPYGICEFTHLAKQLNLPKIVSIQNAFSLINRVFSVHNSEACRYHNVSLIAYSPLAFGLLTGKYLNGIPQNTRLDLFKGFGMRYDKGNMPLAVKAYVEIAQKFNLTPAQLALAFVRSRWFVTSTIIGATTMEQLKENLDSINVNLSEDILTEINAVHSQYPNPTP